MPLQKSLEYSDSVPIAEGAVSSAPQHNCIGQGFLLSLEGNVKSHLGSGLRLRLRLGLRLGLGLRLRLRLGLGLGGNVKSHFSRNKWKSNVLRIGFWMMCFSMEFWIREKGITKGTTRSKEQYY